MDQVYSKESRLICDYLSSQQIKNIIEKILDNKSALRQTYTYLNCNFSIHTNIEGFHDGFSARFRRISPEHTGYIPSLYLISQRNAIYDTVVLSPKCLILIKNLDCFFFFGKLNLKTFQMVGGSIGICDDEEAGGRGLTAVIKTLFEIELLKCFTKGFPCIDLLHASCVVGERNPILICGQSHSGKSTLAAALCLSRGYSLFNDDNTCIDLKNKVLYQFPHSINIRDGGRQLLLQVSKENLINNLRISAEGKYAIDSAKNSIPVFFLDGFSKEPEMTKLSRQETLFSMMNHFFIQEDVVLGERLMQLNSLPFTGYRLKPGELTRTIKLIESIL